MKREGFTLIELLAVIVILAIILVIAIPSISGIVNSATRSAFEDDTKMILQQLEYELLQDHGFNMTSVTEENIDDLKLSNSNYGDLSISIVNSKPYILIVGKNKWNGLKACGTIKNINVVQASDEDACIVSDYIASESVNKPKLATGMIPVKWVTDHWVTTTEDDDDWYSYTTTDKQWANVIQVSNPSSYTESDTTVTMSDVIAMWVWIPRYIYNISDGWHQKMTETTAGTIEVQFSMNTDDTRGGTVTLTNTGNASDSDGTWTSHPAFNFGDDPVTGIWVAKFKASGTTSAIDVKPNVQSLRTTTIGNMFTATRNMETNTRYGWGNTGANIDTHLMKNIEWGAVAYLTQSTYGKNDEVYINPSVSCITGRGGQAVSQSSTTDELGTASATLYSYDGKSCSSKTDFVCTGTAQGIYGMASSTTGNIYGIYDMSGGGLEQTSAYVDNESTSTYGASIISAVSTNPKYADIYLTGIDDTSNDNYNASTNHKGDAIYETSGVNGTTNWYKNLAYMPYTGQPWFVRGGNYADETNASVYYFYHHSGMGYENVTFRPVVLVGAGL